MTVQSKWNPCEDMQGMTNHALEKINANTLKCIHCKSYFKEVDVNGVLLTE